MATKNRTSDPNSTLAPWTRFIKSIPDPAVVERRIAQWAIKENLSMAEARAEFHKSDAHDNYINSRYHVAVWRLGQPAPDWPVMARCTITRLDRRPMGEEHFRDLQRVKNEIFGVECTAVEVYPPESDLVDVANGYWLYVIEDPTFSFPFVMHHGRSVKGPGEGIFPNHEQKPFESGEHRRGRR